MEKFLKIKATYAGMHSLDRLDNQDCDAGSKRKTFFSESQISVSPLRSWGKKSKIK